MMGILNNNFTLTLVQKSSTSFYMEEKYGPTDKRIKATDIKRDENFQKNRRMHTFLHLQKE